MMGPGSASRPGLQDQTRSSSTVKPSAAVKTSSTKTSSAKTTTGKTTTIRTSRSANNLGSVRPLSQVNRTNSEEVLIKPTLGSRTKKTSLHQDNTQPPGVITLPKSGIPTLRGVPSCMSRDRVYVKDQLRSSASRRMVSTLLKQPKARGGAGRHLEGRDQELQQTRTTDPDPDKVLVLLGELREENGRFQREMEALREENQLLKEKLLSVEASPPNRPSSDGLPSDRASSGPAPCSGSETSLSESISPRLSTAGSLTSAECQDMWDQIHTMEENHHSMVQEVKELKTENQRVAEDKHLLQLSLQRTRLEFMAQSNEALVGGLQDRDQVQRTEELQQRYTQLLETPCSGHEKLADVQQQLTESLQVLEQDNREAQAQEIHLCEELDQLQAQLDTETGVTAQADEAAHQQEVAVDAVRMENSGLLSQLDLELQKAVQLNTMQIHATEVQNLPKTAHTDCYHLEAELIELRQELLQAHVHTEHVRNTMAKVQGGAERREQELMARVSSLEESEAQAQQELKELKETIYELEDQVEQQRAEGLHTQQNLHHLDNLVKKLEEQKAEAQRQLKLLSQQMKEEQEEWRRFQADLQTAVVVANDIKVEAQQEVRTLRRRLQEEQEHSAQLSADLKALQGLRLSSFDSLTLVEGH